jgi:hypothetical protein
MVIGTGSASSMILGLVFKVEIRKVHHFLHGRPGVGEPRNNVIPSMRKKLSKELEIVLCLRGFHYGA